MRLIFHGVLRELYGVSAVMKVDSVAEAIEGFSRQQPDWPRNTLISAVGFDTPEKLAENSKEVHLMPALVGGGGKYIKIAIGTALIVASFVVPAGPWTPIMQSAGVALFMSGVMGFFNKAPKLKGSDDPEASKYLGINRNTTAVNTPITLAWGQIDLAGHWLSLQSDSTNLSHGSFPANPT